MPEQETMPRVKSLRDAEFWMGVMHRRTCQDSDHHVQTLERFARLERKHSARAFWLGLPALRVSVLIVAWIFLFRALGVL